MWVQKLSFHQVYACIILVYSTSLESVTYFFAHGLANNYKQAYSYTKTAIIKRKEVVNDRYILNSPLVTFNFPDAKGLFAKIFRVNFMQTSFAQDNELEATLQAYSTINDPQGAVIMGVSRGAAVAAAFASMVCSTAAKMTVAPLRALILESPFDSFLDALNDKIKKAWLRTLAASLVKHGMPFFKYDSTGKQPIDTVELISPDLPILLVCSLEDTTVMASSTKRLYMRLRSTGHKHVYLLILTIGAHARLLSGPEGHTYHAVVHAFYKRYGLPYEEASAELGLSLLAQCQPDCT